MLPPTKTIDLTHHIAGVPLKRRFKYGFQYSDCWVDDARLVVLNALDAAERGATIRTRTKCMRAERSDHWRLVLNARGNREVVTARVLVNAAGPWVDEVGEMTIRQAGPSRTRLVKGSHIVVKRLFDHDSAYIFQNPDGRVVFAIPFATDFTLIGTTDEDFKGDVNSVAPSAEEIKYLCEAAMEYFRQAVSPDDVVWTFAGVRALYDEAPQGRKMPRAIINSISTSAMAKRRCSRCSAARSRPTGGWRSPLCRCFRRFSPWGRLDRARAVAGRQYSLGRHRRFIAKTRERWPFLSAAHAKRLVHAYGTRIDNILGVRSRSRISGSVSAPISPAPRSAI